MPTEGQDLDHGISVRFYPCLGPCEIILQSTKVRTLASKFFFKNSCPGANFELDLLLWIFFFLCQLYTCQVEEDGRRDLCSPNQTTTPVMRSTTRNGSCPTEESIKRTVAEEQEIIVQVTPEGEREKEQEVVVEVSEEEEEEGDLEKVQEVIVEVGSGEKGEGIL